MHLAIIAALAEDIGSGDITTLLTIPAGAMAVGVVKAKQALRLAGVELLADIFPCPVEVLRPSGDTLEPGDSIAIVRGRAQALLTRERTALNFLQRLSGIATLTAQYVKAVEGTGCGILDTRKTTPGLRQLEKRAVAAGGGANHRLGLYDRVLIKNNHIAAAGGVRAALERTRNALVPVEIEVRSMAEVDEALAAGASHLLLDNLTPGLARQWIAHIAGRATVELSGGITLATIRAFAESGADFISCGALTHSAPAVDINFTIERVV